jgi:hypothetical protein
LEELQALVIALADWLLVMAEECDVIRERARAIPGAVALSLADRGNARAIIVHTIERETWHALAELSGGDAEAGHYAAPDDLDSGDFEDVDGVARESENGVAFSESHAH